MIKFLIIIVETLVISVDVCLHWMTVSCDVPLLLAEPPISEIF